MAPSDTEAAAEKTEKSEKAPKRPRRVFLAGNPERGTLPLLLGTVMTTAFTDKGGIVHGPQTRTIQGLSKDGMVYGYVLEANAPFYDEQLAAMRIYADKLELVEQKGSEDPAVPQVVLDATMSPEEKLQEYARMRAERSDPDISEPLEQLKAKDDHIAQLEEEIAALKAANAKK